MFTDSGGHYPAKGSNGQADGGVDVDVVSSKPGDCAADSRAAVQLADLQEDA